MSSSTLQGIVSGSSRWLVDALCSPFLLGLSFALFFCVYGHLAISCFHHRPVHQCPRLWGSSAIHLTDSKSSVIRLQCGRQGKQLRNALLYMFQSHNCNRYTKHLSSFHIFFLLVLNNDLGILEYYSLK